MNLSYIYYRKHLSKKIIITEKIVFDGKIVYNNTDAIRFQTKIKLTICFISSIHITILL